MESYIGNLPQSLLGIKETTNVIADFVTDGATVDYNVFLPKDLETLGSVYITMQSNIATGTPEIAVMMGQNTTVGNYYTQYNIHSKTGLITNGQHSYALFSASNGTNNSLFTKGSLGYKGNAFQWLSESMWYNSGTASVHRQNNSGFEINGGYGDVTQLVVRHTTPATAIPAGVHVMVYTEEATNLILPLEYSAPRKNYFRNPTFQVNQREYAGGAVAAATRIYDGWKVSWSGGGTKSFPVDAAGFITLGAGVSMFQGFEWCEALASKKMTVSWEGSAKVWVEAADGYTYEIHDSPYTFITQSTVGANGELDYFGFSGGTVKNVKLEVGDSATPFDPPDYGSDLAECQRYFVAIGGGAYDSFGIGMARSSPAQQARIQVALPVPMRAGAHTVTSAGTLGLWDGSTIRTATAIAADSYNPFRPTLNVTVASGLTARDPYELLANNDATTRLYFDREL